MSIRPVTGGRGRMPGANVRSVNYATSPLLASRTPPGRSRFVVALVALAFIGLAARAVWVQVLHADFYQRQGEKRYLHTEDVPAGRGRVLDRHGQMLAGSVPAVDVVVDAPAFEASADQRRALAKAIEMKPAELDR
ncbi:MAG: penicillin-binding protein 2, partial [Rubrivivax sp.]